MSPRSVGPPASPTRVSTNHRLFVWYAAIIFVFVVIVARLFYLQVIKHDYYQQAALNDQLKQYTITADRGIIKAHQGNGIVPLVLNQKLYTLFADPALVKNVPDSSAKLIAITEGSSTRYSELMKIQNSRYQVLAKRLSEGQKEKILALKLPGIGLQAENYRIYPQGKLAAQLLGFVDLGGRGRYGLEQQFNTQLAGKSGNLKAITDVNGVPLAASRDNIRIDPKPGDDLVLTIDVAMQSQIEKILADGLKKVGSKSGSAILMDPYTGSIKAMANYPTYDPAKYYEVNDLAAFNNAAVASPLEVGSIMKTLTISTGLNEGVITPSSSYHDPGYVKIEGSTIKNVLPIPRDPTTVKDILQFSLNTGAVHVLKELGGGELNQRGRDTWHEYLTDHFQLGKYSGIEQPTEASGSVPNPDKGYGLNIQYANTAFGQGITSTMLQMASALSSVVNGGTYYQPHLLEKTIKPADGATPINSKAIKRGVIKPAVSKDMQKLLQFVFEQNHNVYHANVHPGYKIGGKTGTGQIPYKGGYKVGVYNGTYLGFVGGDKPQYVVAVLVNAPNLPSFESAGSQAAAPIFGQIADMLINNFDVQPASR
jgi:cell division protein FtsI/penicillin-binding protein 2